MRISFAFLSVLALVTVGCGKSNDDKDSGGSGKSGSSRKSGPVQPGAIDQNSPQSLAMDIFDAARSGNYDVLKGIAAPDADRDAKNVANIGQANAKAQASFKKFFEKGRVAGIPKITGNSAAVPILFGPDGTKKETFNMVRIDGKWYLQSF